MSYNLVLPINRGTSSYPFHAVSHYQSTNLTTGTQLLWHIAVQQMAPTKNK